MLKGIGEKFTTVELFIILFLFIFVLLLLGFCLLGFAAVVQGVDIKFVLSINPSCIILLAIGFFLFCVLKFFKAFCKTSESIFLCGLFLYAMYVLTCMINLTALPNATGAYVVAYYTLIEAYRASGIMVNFWFLVWTVIYVFDIILFNRKSKRLNHE